MIAKKLIFSYLMVLGEVSLVVFRFLVSQTIIPKAIRKANIPVISCNIPVTGLKE